MKKQLSEGKNSNYEVTISFGESERAGVKNHVLEHFAKDINIPGFRAGKVPMHMVEQKVQPQYVEMAIVEHLVNQGIQELLNEHSDIKFIGEPYNFNTKEDKGETHVTFSLDVYPEVDVKGKNWETVKMKEIKVEATDKEIEDSLVNIQKNYADYKDTDSISGKDTISKLGLEFVDKDGNVVDKGTTYLGETEFDEDKFWMGTFGGKKKKDIIEIPYNEKKLPQVLHAKKDGAKTLKVTIQDIKQIVLPELNDDMILKLFGKNAEVKTSSELRDYIKREILKQKQENELIHSVEEYILGIKKSGVSVVIPKTMKDQEVKVRMQNLEKRFGSQEKVREYFQQLGEEKAKEFVEGVEGAAAESLEKFFILNKITELLGLKIDWNNEKEPFFVEKQLYEKLVGELPNSEAKKETKKVTKKAKKE